MIASITTFTWIWIHKTSLVSNWRMKKNFHNFLLFFIFPNSLHFTHDINNITNSFNVLSFFFKFYAHTVCAMRKIENRKHDAVKRKNVCFSYQKKKVFSFCVLKSQFSRFVIFVISTSPCLLSLNLYIFFYYRWMKINSQK
jgi:hypothetical protein